MKKQDSKQRLFEVMGKLDSSFKKKLTEDVQLVRYDDSEPVQHLSDFENRVYDFIEKSYPNIQHMIIAEKFIPNKGWINCNSPLDEINIDKLTQEGVTLINLKITDHNGDIAYPDYSMEEFKKFKNN